MIPKRFIDAWRKEAPWPSQDMVEQDLILSKAISDISIASLAPLIEYEQTRYRLNRRTRD